MPRTIGIIGYGKFGAFVYELVKRFAPEVPVRIYSSRNAPDGKLFYPLAEAARCDVVVLCVPIHAFEENLAAVLPLLGERSVLVDVATVKMHTVEILKRLAPGRRFLATHPMFGPESYAKQGGDVSGLRLVVAAHTLKAEEFRALRAFLEQCGLAVIEMSAEEHDRQLAQTLFLTHFVGQLVARAGFDRTRIDTLSFGYLMDAVESVKRDTALFQDVFRFNPFCEEVLGRFEGAEKDVHTLLKKVCILEK